MYVIFQIHFRPIIRHEQKYRCLELRFNEHSNFRTSSVGKHLYECEHFHYIVNLFNTSVCSISEPSFIEAWYHISSAIPSNTRVIDKNNNWIQLCFLESLYIRRLNPVLNEGIRATKELNLFRCDLLFSSLYFSALLIVDVGLIIA